MSQAGIFVSPVLPPGEVVQTIEGNTGGPVGPNAGNNIFVVGDGTTIIITGNPADNTLTASVIGGSSIITLDGDVGSITGNVLTFHGLPQAGSSVFFSGVGTTMSLNTTDANNNTIIGITAGNTLISGIDNTSLGSNTLHALTSGDGNVALGNDALKTCTDGGDNVGIGTEALRSLTSGSSNSAIGISTLNITTGSDNVALGQLSGNLYTGNESSNIVIGNTGVNAESNTIRLGTNGSGTAQQNRCFIAGIDGVSVGTTANVVTEVGNQLGTAVITAGMGITITPTDNVITIASSGIFYTYINVNTSPYFVLDTDVYLSVDSSTIPITILLPDSALLGEPFIVKDRTGNAATNNISITTVSGLTTIDGTTNFVMDSAYQSISIVGNGSTYELY
jgi:hypothetical protein